MDKKIDDLAAILAEALNGIVENTLWAYETEVYKIINNKSQDIHTIERALDALCEAAFDERILLLFRRLCKYYYSIDPIATAEHVQMYREMWDSESLDRKTE